MISSPRWPCAAAGLTTTRAAGGRPAPSSLQAGCGTPARSNARRCSRLSVTRAAVAASSGCGSPSAAATSAATRTGPSVPGEIRPPARSRRASASTALRIHRRDLLEAVGEALAHAERLRIGVARDRLDAEPPRRRIGAELAGTRAEDDEGRRRNRQLRAETCAAHHAGLSAYQRIVRSRPSSKPMRARQPTSSRRLVGRADVAVDLARPVGHVRDQGARLAEAVADALGDALDVDVDPGRDVQHLARDALERRADDRRDRLARCPRRAASPGSRCRRRAPSAGDPAAPR